MDWARMLAYVTGTVDQELLARNEYLGAENRSPDRGRRRTRVAKASVTALAGALAMAKDPAGS